MWNSYNILTFTILRHFRTVPMGTVRILWFFLVLRNFWVGTVKKPTCIYPSILNSPEHSILRVLVVGQWFLELVNLQQKLFSDALTSFSSSLSSTKPSSSPRCRLLINIHYTKSHSSGGVPHRPWLR